MYSDTFYNVYDLIIKSQANNTQTGSMLVIQSFKKRAQ